MQMKRALLLAACLALPACASAEEPAPQNGPIAPAAGAEEAAPAAETAPTAEAPAETALIGEADGPTAILVMDRTGETAGSPAPSASVTAAGTDAAEDAAAADAPAVAEAARSHPVEVQMEVIEHRFTNDGHINNYTVHLYQEMKRNGTVSFWRGLTMTRAQGWLNDDNRHRDSDAWGLGPSFMIRWEKPVSEKWSVGIDGTGSLLAYNHAFPAGGRAFGFMWRIGPRVSYYPDKDSAIRLGYSFMHCSNGFSSHNPGYNGVGFSLMYAHNF